MESYQFNFIVKKNICVSRDERLCLAFNLVAAQNGKDFVLDIT